MKTITTLSLTVTGMAIFVTLLCAGSSSRWTESEIAELDSMHIRMSGPLPDDPANRVADDDRAAALGERLFFDAALSSNGKVSCATCHDPNRNFQDSTPLAQGVGTTDRRTMPIAGAAYSPFLFWDGRKDSLWAQALGPLESPVEHGGSRAQYAHLIAERYRTEYEAVFGALPDLSGVPRNAGPVAGAGAAETWKALTDPQRDAVTGVFVNIGKAIAAYERSIQYGPSRFDIYVQELVETGREPQNVLSDDEVAGLRLFTGKANCTQCHNGPLFSNNEFHNNGAPAVRTLPSDRGRMTGAAAVLADEFNCRSRWSDAAAGQCNELDFMITDSPELEGAFKTPSLRNVADRAPYMHAGQMASLSDVLDHYNRAPKAPVGRSEIHALKLNARELRQLEAFLRSLSGPIQQQHERTNFKGE